MVSQLDHTCMCLPQTRGHTSHVALFWVKFPPSNVVKIMSVQTSKKVKTERGHTFYVAHFWAKFLLIYIQLWRFGQPTRQFLSVSFPNKGSHFRCRTFLSYSYSCEGLVSQLDHTCLVSLPNKGSHFTCRTFLLKFVLIYICEGMVSQLDHTCLCLRQTRGHTLRVTFFFIKICTNL